MLSEKTLSGVQKSMFTCGSSSRRRAMLCLALVRPLATMQPPSTIFALSSGRGVAGVAVIRISGPKAHWALEKMLLDGKSAEESVLLPKPRFASLRKLYSKGSLLDEAVVVRFDAPKSFTGEDVVELHCHGGVATVSGVLETLGEELDLAPAEAGEFTRRAFSAGKLSLTEVEGLADLLTATTSKQRDLALSVASGSLERRYEDWRQRLSSIRAAAEAAIDFGDHVEGEVDSESAMRPLAGLISDLSDDLRRAVADADRTLAIRDGAIVVLAGPPNAGKSSLVNAMAARPAAIVSETAGTTRDVLEVRLNLGGYEVRLFDTAGLRDSSDEIEAEGVRRALDLCDGAQVVCYVVDASDPPRRDQDIPPRVDLYVANKIDLVDNLSGDLFELGDGQKLVRTSAVDASGADELVDAIRQLVVEKLDSASSPQGEEEPAIVRDRHKRHISRCLEALDEARFHFSQPELFAEDLRVATVELGYLVGAIDVEDVLDSLFRDFCIGK